MAHLRILGCKAHSTSQSGGVCIKKYHARLVQALALSGFYLKLMVMLHNAHQLIKRFVIPQKASSSICTLFLMDASNVNRAGSRCPGDCNGNGQCWYGKCTCHVGFVGEDCKLQACSRNSCPGGMKCNLLLGRCESDEGTYILPKSPTPSAKEPEPVGVCSKHQKYFPTNQTFAQNPSL